MSEQVLNQFRSDKALREDCIAIYEAMGMDLNTAFRMIWLFSFVLNSAIAASWVE